MKKHLQSTWMRVVSQLVCVIAVLSMLIGVAGFVFVTEFEDVDGIYKEGYDDIAENYSLYAIEMIQRGKENELRKFFENNKINATIKYLTYAGIENETLSFEEETLFSTGTVAAENREELLMVSGSQFHYAKNSLLGMLFGYRHYYEEGEWVEYPVHQVVYDPGQGLFFYQTDIGYIKVPDIKIYWQGNTWVDYVLTIKNDKEVYYNGYYDEILDPLTVGNWEAVEIEDVYSTLQASSSGDSHWGGAVLVVPDHWVPTDEIVTSNYSIGAGTILASSPENSDYYQVELSWDGAYGLDNCFSEWLAVCGVLDILDAFFVPMIVVGFLLFAVDFAILIYSANKEKEAMSLMCKVPVFFYTVVIGLVEFLLCGLVALCCNWFILQDKGEVKSAVMILTLLVGIITWILFAWVQNIVTRIKCKSFWRTSEIYYGGKFIKNSWIYLVKPVKWCWGIVTSPFRAIGKTCKNMIGMIQTNTPVFGGGIAIFVGISFIEYLLYMWNRWSGEGLSFVFFVVKILELAALIVVLYYLHQLHEGSKRIASGDLSTPVDTRKMFWKLKDHGENINKVSDGIQLAVNERMKSEHFKTELITNVSHDIKTPLTSIINYVDLIKKEDISDEKVQGYVEVLDRQSARLKKLIEDLMEASKASTGNLAVNLEECDVEVLLTQIIGEFEERLQKNQLEVVVTKPDHPVKMLADGRHMWRVVDNLLNNACKYSLPGSRVYVSLEQNANEAIIVFKNISKTALNISSEELMERFVRGDSSRNTEGSGLGLSIAQSLTELMHGSMKLEIDGDLFKVSLRFPTMG